MLYYTRKKGSTRTSRKRKLVFYPNYVGSGGFDAIILEVDDTYVYIEPETEADVKEILSQAHILHHNFPEPK